MFTTHLISLIFMIFTFISTTLAGQLCCKAQPEPTSGRWYIYYCPNFEDRNLVMQNLAPEPIYASIRKHRSTPTKEKKLLESEDICGTRFADHEIAVFLPASQFQGSELNRRISENHRQRLLASSPGCHTDPLQFSGICVEDHQGCQLTLVPRDNNAWYDNIFASYYD